MNGLFRDENRSIVKNCDVVDSGVDEKGDFSNVMGYTAQDLTRIKWLACRST